MAQNRVYDTIILGAGWSGAVAARDLASKGHSVLVLEARSRVGGRAKTWKSKHDNAKIDIGCSFIHGYLEGNPAGSIAKELGVTANLPKPAESLIYGPDGPLPKGEAQALQASLSAAQASLKLPHPTPAPSVSLGSALLAPTSPLFTGKGAPDERSDANQTNPADPSLAAKSQVAATSGPKNLASGLARLLEIPLGLKLEKASLRWAGWETTTNFAGSDAAPAGGYEALVSAVVDDAQSKGAKFTLNSEVKGVKEAQGTVTVTTKDGQTYEGKTVVCTIPLAVLKTFPAGFFQPALPPQLQAAIAGTHVGCLEKLLLRYPKTWWPNADRVASFIFLPTSTGPITSNSSLEDIFAASTLSTASFAASTLPDTQPILLTYLSVDPATQLLQKPEGEVAAAFHKYLIKRFGVSGDVPEPSEVALTNWLTDEYALGATTTPSIISENGERSPLDFKELGRPTWGGRLGFAGEHTEMEHRGSVAGAVVSGQREAARVDRLLNLWKQ